MQAVFEKTYLDKIEAQITAMVDNNNHLKQTLKNEKSLTLHIIDVLQGLTNKIHNI